MKNVYDQKKEKKLNIILSDKNYSNVERISKEDFKDVAIFVHLYYEKSVEYFFEYIKNIPHNIDLYISFSTDEMEELVKSNLIKISRNNCICVKKENRGRDISSFLVAFRPYILKYNFFCFVHDKNEKKNNEVRQWIDSLWRNMLASPVYICNVIDYLKKNSNIGLLVPPSLISEYVNIALKDLWCNDYEITCDLAYKLNLNCNLDSSKSPITQGTCFWARTSALNKLLLFEWEYEDFQDEPLPGDGTLSHAIERILAYVAQDTGYDTGWIMTDTFASEYIESLCDFSRAAYRILLEELEVGSVYEIIHRNEKKARISQFAQTKNRIYIYGAGKVGREAWKCMMCMDIPIEAFVITENSINENLFGIPIREFSPDMIGKEDGIIIAVGNILVDEIYAYLINTGIDKKQLLIYRE